MDDLASAQAEIVRLKDQLSAASTDAETRVEAVRNQLSAAKTRAKAVIQKQRAQAEERVEKFERKLEEQAVRLGRLEAVEAESGKLKQRTEELDALVGKGREDLDRVLREKEEAEENLIALQGELGRVKEVSRVERVSLQRNILKLKEDLHLRSDENGVANGNSSHHIESTASREVEEARALIASLEATCAELRSENQRLTQRHDRGNFEANGYANGDENGRASGGQVSHAPVGELWLEVRQAKERADELADEMAKTSAEFTTRQRDLQKTVDELFEEKKGIEEQLTSSQKQISQLQDDLQKSDFALQGEREKVISVQRNASEASGSGDEAKKIMEAKIAEMERVIASKHADVVKVREKAKTYLKDMNAEKRDMEERMKQQIKALRKAFEEEQEKVKAAEQRVEGTTSELDNCLALIRDKQKTVQMLRMAVSTEKYTAQEAQKQTESVRAEFYAYKERARIALQERDNVAGVSEDPIEEATSALRTELEKSRKEIVLLRQQVAAMKDANAKIDELVGRAEKAEAVVDLLRKDATGVSTANYTQIDALEEKLATVQGELRAVQVSLGDSEDRHETTKMRLEAAERAHRSAEIRAEEAARVSAKTVEGLKKQVAKLEQELDRAKKSSAAAQRTAAAAAKALYFTGEEDPRKKASPSKNIVKSPTARDTMSGELSPYSSSGNLTPGRASFVAAMEGHSDSLGFHSRRSGSQGGGSFGAKADMEARDQQIAVLTAQVAELGAMFDEVQQETNLKSEQVAVLKTEVKNLDAKLAAAEKLQNGAPFSYLRTIVVRYLETDDATLLPVISNVLSFTEDETARVQAGRGARPSTPSLAGTPHSSGYFSLPFLGSR